MTRRHCARTAPAAAIRRRLAAILAAACLAGLVGTATPLPAAASTDLPALCEAAAHDAATRSGVPLPVLRAIALTETGRRHDGAQRPWPWTVNMEGKGLWFADLGAARAYVGRHYARGARSFDVGCFQINYRWHHQHFTSIDEMFDPVANARYAARFMRQLYDELGDWSRAAGAFHSRTPDHARRYRARFDRHLAALGAAPIPSPSGTAGPAPVPEPARVNRFPLLLADAAAPRGLGSLVPPTGSDRRLIDAGGGRP